MTDILPNHQDKGYGKILRNQTANIFRNFIGKPNLFVEQPEKTLIALYSDNEWCWGENHPSLSTSISAGYGVVCITPGMGLAHMFFPSNELVWNEKRINHLLAASKSLMSAFSRIDIQKLPIGETAKSHLCANITSEEGRTIIENFMDILENLDLCKDADACSFLAIASFLLEDIKGSFNSDYRLATYFSSLKKKEVLRLIDLMTDEQNVLKIGPPCLRTFTGFSNIGFYEMYYSGQ